MHHTFSASVCAHSFRTLSLSRCILTDHNIQNKLFKNHEKQQVSVDVVNHFISTDLPGLFSAALSSVPLGHVLAGEAINAILDPLEMMTR